MTSSSECSTPWCRDHTADIDGGWCSSHPIQVGDARLQLSTGTYDGAPEIFGLDNALARAESLTLEAAERIAVRLRDVVAGFQKSVAAADGSTAGYAGGEDT